MINVLTKLALAVIMLSRNFFCQFSQKIAVCNKKMVTTCKNNYDSQGSKYFCNVFFVAFVVKEYSKNV